MKQVEKTGLTKERILKAAMVEFGAKGYSGASINNICETGISKGLIYHNYKSKTEIYLACVERCFCGLTCYLKQQEIGFDPHKYMAARLCFFREHENEARLFFETVLQPPIQLKEQIAELRADFDAFNLELYKRVISSVTLRCGVTEEDALSYFNLMQTMFNGYFVSPACVGMSVSDRMTAHEAKLSKLFDLMLYGIAERGV